MYLIHVKNGAPRENQILALEFLICRSDILVLYTRPLLEFTYLHSNRTLNLLALLGQSLID